ncbi:hypothetical protein QJQ45_006441 [Haematococcus lacustris]|nr:hypothetical protein QJQ45_006441 [Haematococcus lacustris]
MTEEIENAVFSLRYDSDEESSPPPSVLPVKLDISHFTNTVDHQVCNEDRVMEGGEDDEDEDDEDDEDGETVAAMQWADMREDLAARGYATSAYSGGAGTYHPNSQARRAAALQPWSSGLQRLDNKFNGCTVPHKGHRGAGSGHTVFDDPLDVLGSHADRVTGSVANEVCPGVTAVRLPLYSPAVQPLWCSLAASQPMRCSVPQMRAYESREAAARQRVTVDKADRATVEQAIDPRTRMVLFKMLNRGLFLGINGCISTGKEANVYHASTGTGSDLAIKIYKTSILVFKDRDRYVSGDFRFRNGYCRSNPRKMVKMWAEKEMRNLARLRAAGIRAPAPLQLRMHVLVMDFIGEDGVAAPRLRDADLPLPRLREAYTELVCVVRTLYQKCRLVHADLSEYNILVHKGELHIIDVSQAVDLDHPKALDFLREDCLHVNDFFKRRGIATLTVRELFDFAVDPNIADEQLDAALDRLIELAASRPAGSVEDEVSAAVFQQAFIPKCLDEVIHYERDHDKLQASNGKHVEGIYYQAMTGFAQGASAQATAPAAETTPSSSTSMAHNMVLKKPAVTGVGLAQDDAFCDISSWGAALAVAQPAVEAVPLPSDGSGRDGSDSDDSGSSSDGSAGGCEGLSKEAVKAERKANKKAVKAANKEKRKAKKAAQAKKPHKSSGSKGKSK